MGFGPGRIWGFFSHSFHFLAFGTAPWALGALPLRCPALAGPSHGGKPGVPGVGGLEGPKQVAFGVSLPQTVTQDCWTPVLCCGYAEPATRGAPRDLRDRPVPTSATAWVVPPAREGSESWPPGARGLRASVCAALPAAPASEVARGLVSCALGPRGPSPSRPDLVEAVRSAPRRPGRVQGAAGPSSEGPAPAPDSPPATVLSPGRA